MRTASGSGSDSLPRPRPLPRLSLILAAPSPPRTLRLVVVFVAVVVSDPLLSLVFFLLWGFLCRSDTMPHAALVLQEQASLPEWLGEGFFFFFFFCRILFVNFVQTATTR